MGNEQSIPMEMCSTFDLDEIKRLGKRFRKLDIDNSGSLSVEEFMTLPELQQNPLVQRVIDIFDEDQNGEVDFREFIQGVSQFSVKGDKGTKLRFAFRIYDVDNDGYISNGELFQVLKMMVGNNLKDSQLQQIVDKTILYADKDEDGKISFEEFCAVVGNTDIHKKMVVDVWQISGRSTNANWYHNPRQDETPDVARMFFALPSSYTHHTNWFIILIDMSHDLSNITHLRNLL